MTTATPHLSSPPSRVVPSVVTSVLPTTPANSGHSLARITLDGSPGNTMSRPS